MKADQAYQLAKQNTLDIEAIVELFAEHIYTTIEYEARRGKFYTNIQIPIKLKSPTTPVRLMPAFIDPIPNKLKKKLESDGYRVIENAQKDTPAWSWNISWEQAK